MPPLNNQKACSSERAFFIKGSDNLQKKIIILLLFLLLIPTPVQAPEFIQKPVFQTPSRSVQAEIFQSTAYTWTGNKTATGAWPEKGTIAVDPDVIPLGTLLWVEGYGIGIATDTGGAIKGHIIDVFFPTKEECIQWGRRDVRVIRR